MAQLEQVSPPGTVASCNNAAYVLAGRLIEKVTGQAHEAVIKRLILDPLGCTESFFFAGDVMTRRFAIGHSRKEQEAAVTVARPMLLPRSSAPAGGLFSTVRDQIRYARFHLGGVWTIVSPEGRARRGAGLGVGAGSHAVSLVVGFAAVMGLIRHLAFGHPHIRPRDIPHRPMGLVQSDCGARLMAAGPPAHENSCGVPPEAGTRREMS